MAYYEIDYDTLDVIDQQLHYELFKGISNGNLLHCTILMHNILILLNTNSIIIFNPVNSLATIGRFQSDLWVEFRKKFKK
mgnify:CR=1 FL=1